MDLLDKKSIILQIGDLKLSDTAYTFDQHRLLNGFEYCPLEYEYQQLDHFVRGDAREGER